MMSHPWPMRHMTPFVSYPYLSTGLRNWLSHTRHTIIIIWLLLLLRQ
jgi:hypothetical protein